MCSCVISHRLSLYYSQTLVDVFSLLTKTHLPTLVVSAVSMTFLIAVKELNSYLSPKLPVPIPVELIMVSGQFFLGLNQLPPLH